MSNFCGNSDITKIFVIEGGFNEFTGGTVNGNLIVSGNIINCGTGSTIQTETIIACESGVTINNNSTFYQTEIVPTADNLISLGTLSRRFRSINTVSGTSTVWTSTDAIYTPILNLGLDLSGNTRILTSDNSVIQDDVLNGGIY